jgi:hypothetical protein
LLEHGVNQGSFAVVYVGDDGDVANIFGHFGKSVLGQKGLLKQPAARTNPFFIKTGAVVENIILPEVGSATNGHAAVWYARRFFEMNGGLAFA